jgi:mevalonate kinase
MSSEGQACGKVILLGEHAVVYGVPAIAVGIDRGARARVTPAAAGPSKLEVRGWELAVSEEDVHHDLGRAFAALLGAVREANSPDRSGTWCPPNLVVEVEADLPPGAGLGCSAAMGVAIARALAPDAGGDRIEALAAAWERVFHGNPSGIDAAVAVRGGCVAFERRDEGSVLEPIHVRGGLTLAIGDTGIASSTKTMVEAVGRLKWRRPQVVAKAFEGIRALVKNARLAIEDGDRFALGRLMDLNQMLLSGLFVSTPEIETLCDVARAAGALGAKLTGAGGGGSVVALVNGVSGAERVLEAWKRVGYAGFATRVAPTDVTAAFASGAEA